MLTLLIALKWPLIILQAIFSLVLVILIMLQSGKGDDMGSALGGGGGGGSGSVLGTGGASKFLVRGTVIFMTLFMLNSIVLAKIFKEISTTSIGTSVSEPLAPAPAPTNNGAATNAIEGSPTPAPVAPAPAKPAPAKK
jgi:preprotein translocase subunit SecG